MGLIIMYDPVSEVDKMITSLAYLKVMSPNGMVKRISNATRDQTEWTLKIELKMVLTRAPRINPKTKLNLILHAPMKKIDKLISLVSPYAVRVEAKRINKSEK